MPSANGLTLLSATLWRPRVGRWTAELSCDGSDAASLSGAVVIDVGGVTYKGTAKQAGAFHERVGAFVVGGSGRLHEELPSKFYRDVPVSAPLGDILGAVGETLAATADSAITGKQLPRWTRMKGTAADALIELLGSVGATWRHLEDGTIWVGTETWPEQTVEHELLEELSSDAQAVIAPVKLELRPGVTFLGRHVEHVTHRLEDGSLRSEALFTSGASAAGRLRQALEALVRRLIAPAEYDVLRPAKVVAQNGDGTLDLLPDDPTMPGLSGVVIRNGLPATKVKVPTGERILFGFEGRDPRVPYACLWSESTTLTEIAIGNSPSLVALGPLVDNVVSTIVNAFNSHTHGTGVGPSSPPAAPIAPQDSVAAHKFKVE